VVVAVAVAEVVAVSALAELVVSIVAVFVEAVPGRPKVEDQIVP
jgi:hypothetical protein